MSPASTVLVALVPLVIWRLYSRIRRVVGRQKSQVWRHRATAIFYSLLILLVGYAASANLISSAGLAGGVGAGIALAMWGLRLTRLESTPEGFFYTPNAYIGLALVLLLTGRILYRVIQIHDAAGAMSPAAMQDLGQSPFTLLLFGMLASYYAAYAIGILRWRNAQQPSSMLPR